MDPLRPRSKKGPEDIIRDDIISLLRNRGWWVKITHGNMFQSGLPDLYCANKRYGTRWIEVKNPKKYEFTPAQLIDFPALSGQGVGIWIMTCATESEYKKLFSPPNWHLFLSLKSH